MRWQIDFLQRLTLVILLESTTRLRAKLLKPQVSFSYDLSLEVDKNYKDLVEKFDRNNQRFKSLQLTELLKETKTRTFDNTYDHVADRILKVLYLLADNPIEEGRVLPKSILGEIIKRKAEEQRAAQTNQYMFLGESVKKRAHSESEYSSEGEQEEETIGGSAKHPSKETPVETSDVPQIVIGKKRIKDKQWALPFKLQTETESAKNDVFLTENKSLETNERKPIFFSDLLINSYSGSLRIKNSQKKGLIEAQLAYELLNLILGRKSLEIELLQTDAFNVEFVCKKQFFLENAPSFDPKVIVKKISSLACELAILRLRIAKTSDEGSAVIAKYNYVANDVLTRIQAKYHRLQTILDFQVMGNGKIEDFVSDAALLKEFKTKTITLMQILKFAESDLSLVAFLCKIYEKFEKESLRASKVATIMNCLHSAFEFGDSLMFEKQNTQEINYVWRETLKTFIQTIFEKLVSNQTPDFDFIKEYCQSQEPNEAILLNSFFDGQCQFREDRFPKFFARHSQDLYTAFCDYLIYCKLFQKFGFDKDSYKLPTFLTLRTSTVSAQGTLAMTHLMNIGTYQTFQENLAAHRQANFERVLGVVPKVNLPAVAEPYQQNMKNSEQTTLPKSEFLAFGKQIDSLQNDQMFLSFVAPNAELSNLSSTFAKKRLIFDKIFADPAPRPSLPKTTAEVSEIDFELQTVSQQQTFISESFPARLRAFTAELNTSLNKAIDDLLFLKKTFKFLISFYCFTTTDIKIVEKFEELYAEVTSKESQYSKNEAQLPSPANCNRLAQQHSCQKRMSS